jgi:dihydroxyacetone kinase-like protein
MHSTTLDLEATRDMFRYVAQKMEESKQALTEADKAVGDGDHGVGMARGFRAVRERLIAVPASMDELLRLIGTTLLTSAGGASGALFGTFFRAAANHLGGHTCFTTGTLGQLVTDGLAAVQMRGQAQPGDKSMVDALEPAGRKAQELTGADLPEALAAVAEAARQGMEQTRHLTARVGKAKTLGDRSLGHPDPGAMSVYLMFKFMAEHVQQHAKTSPGDQPR